jgi:CarD family transcriptional regulator
MERAKMYAVGDKVVHPGYGPGVIKGIERRQVIEEAKDYYIIEIIANGATLMTPVAQADKVGLRLAIGDASVKRLFALLSEAPDHLSDDFRERQFVVDERLKESDIFVTAEVIRDMAWYGHVNDLTKRDTQLLQRAEELVAGELALAQGIEIEEALQQMESVLAEAMSDDEEEDG